MWTLDAPFLVVPFVGFALWCEVACACGPSGELLVDPDPPARSVIIPPGALCSPAAAAAGVLNPLTDGLRQTNAQAASRTNVTADVREKRRHMIARS
jgi:hypothetical protein